MKFTVVNTKMINDFMTNAENVIEKGGYIFITQKRYWASRFKLIEISFKFISLKSTKLVKYGYF
ncbi:hypothetical protein [Tenacibaculum maritimum]|uniref:hypothetical protein n=1 Tax=Tenacibaculum maritimum TaxID=107401 RepID=UPI0038767625